MGIYQYTTIFRRVACIVLFIQANAGLANLQPQAGVQTFARNQYKAGAQNWAMARDKNQRLYIANNEGLLVFDGKNWQLFPVPNHTILRSIAFGADGNLYAGAQDELGYFAPDGVGRLSYTSLKALLPETKRHFPDVWQTVATGKTVFFRTNEAIFVFDGQKISIHKPASVWQSLHLHHGKALAQDRTKGLLSYSDGAFKTLIAANKLPANFLITGLSAYHGDTSLLCTEKSGLWYLVGDQLIPFVAQNKAFDIKQHFTALNVLGNKSVMLGSYFNGLFHLSKDGRLLQNISSTSGLQNNTIRCLHADETGSVWMGLDNGLAAFQYQNAIRHINPPAFNNGVGYAALLFQNQLYYALSTGIQVQPMADTSNLANMATPPTVIQKGLSWNIQAIDNKLLASRDDGLWQINNRQAKPLLSGSGFWAVRKTSTPNQWLAGSYLGLHTLMVENNNIKPLEMLSGFSESSRYVETDGEHVWVSHPYLGVYRINRTSGESTLFTQQNGLPTDLDNHVFKVNNKVVFATRKGIYAYNAVSKRMEPAADFVLIFGKRPIRYLKEAPNGNIWFVQEKMVGVVDRSGTEAQLHYIPELSNKIVSGFENIFVANDNNALVGSDVGFYHVNFEQYKQQLRPFSVYLTQIKAIADADSILYGGFNPQKVANNISLPYSLNSLQFSFATTLPGQTYNLEFSYMLQGFEQSWSSWSPKAEQDYTNLREGTYTLHIKARKSPSHESEVATYTFRIEPPIYRTIWAYLLYATAVAAFIFMLLKAQGRRYRKRQEARRLEDQKRFAEEQRRMAYEHQLALEHAEKEKLAKEIEHKNAELASTTMNLVQKKEFILKLKYELQQLQKTTDVTEDQPELKKLLKTLSEEEKLDKEWDQFAQHFDSVYGDFLAKLRSMFPSLKPHELQLCAYLRMNLSSKEIAPLMSISVRGVEIGRYRMRKKLNLSTEENLTQFLMGIG